MALSLQKGLRISLQREYPMLSEVLKFPWAIQGELWMGLTQSLGKVNINTKKGMSVEVNQLEQNTYLFPDVSAGKADEYHYSYMGSNQKIEFNKYSDIISRLSQVEF